MGVYAYRARDATGALVSGKVEAADEREVFRRLREQGLLAVSMELDRDVEVVARLWRRLRYRHIAHRQLALFCRQFATMISAGLPVVDALATLQRQASDSVLRNALVRIANAVRSGDSLSVAFARQGSYFPPLMIHLISAGEVGGNLDEVLVRLADQLEREQTLRQKLRSALTYPGIVVTLACGIVTFLLLFVLPKFVEVFKDLGTPLPWLTRVLMGVGAFAGHYWWAILLAITALVIAVIACVHTARGALHRDRLLLRLPVAGPMLLKAETARFARTLSGLLESGVSIVRALAVVEKVMNNRLLAAEIHRARDEVREGHRLAEPLSRSGLFPPLVVEMLQVGEETGMLEKMLAKIAIYYEEDVFSSAERLASAIEPILIVGMAVTVGLIVVALLLPLFDVWSLLA